MVIRFFIVIGFFIAMAAALASFSIFGSFRKEQAQRLDAESKYIQAQEAASSARADLKQIESRQGDLEAQIEALKKTEREVKTKLAGKDTEIQALKTDIKAKEDEILSLQKKVEDLRRSAATALATNQAVVPATVTTPVVATPKPFEKPAQLVLPPTPTGAAAVIPAEAPPSTDSRILTVNRKFNFVVINVGLRDGLRMGDKVEILQEGKVKATAQIEKIYDKFSAATLLNEDKSNPAHEGDAIRKA